MPKKTMRVGAYVYDLRKSNMRRIEANRLANAIRSSGKRARIINYERGKYAVYVS